MRPIHAQGNHDVQVQRVALAYRARGFTTCANVGSDKACALGGHYPDVVVRDTRGCVTHVVEVETAETVVLGHAREQWPVYGSLARLYQATFVLHVPVPTVLEARRLLQMLGVAAEVHTW